MALIVTNEGETELIKFALGIATPGDQLLHLYVFDDVLDDLLVAADLTEMNSHGYAAKTLIKTSWIPNHNGTVANATYPAQTWVFTADVAPVTVYGYFVTDSISGALLWIERFATPRVVQNTGDQELFTPAFTLSRAP